MEGDARCHLALVRALAAALWPDGAGPRPRGPARGRLRSFSSMISRRSASQAPHVSRVGHVPASQTCRGPPAPSPPTSEPCSRPEALMLQQWLDRHFCSFQECAHDD